MLIGCVRGRAPAGKIHDRSDPDDLRNDGLLIEPCREGRVEGDAEAKQGVLGEGYGSGFVEELALLFLFLILFCSCLDKGLFLGPQDCRVVRLRRLGPLGCFRGGGGVDLWMVWTLDIVIVIVIVFL